MLGLMSDVAPSQPLSLVPVNGCVLVKLENQYENFSTKEGRYDTRTNGIVVAIPKLEYVSVLEIKATELLGKRVYFEEYKEGARIKKGNDLYCFIKLEDVRGYENV